MRILLWHGWTLEGSGSNVYTAKTAQAFRAMGHDVVLLCQERHPRRLGFVDAVGEVDRERVSALEPAGAHAGPGRLTVLRPRIGPLLPVFVVDEYEGFDVVKAFVDLSDEELGGYLARNADTVRVAVAWHEAELVIAGHAIPGSVVAHRALDRGVPYIAKIHGSDLEYAVREQQRYRDLAAEGLGHAAAVAGATRDVLERTVALVPAARGRTVVVAPGVEVDRFRLEERSTALGAAADALEAAGVRRGPGRPETTDLHVLSALRERDARALDDLAGAYDQDAPDPDASARLRSLAATDDPLVGYLGKFIPQKGVHDLLTALPLLAHPVRAVLIGFGGFREWLAALVLAMRDGDQRALRWLREVWPDRLELPPDVGRSANASRVVFTGRLDHRFAPHVLAALDVVVVPSILSEAFGMVAAEAASSGALPLVARHSGLSEVALELEGAVGRPGSFSYRPGPGAPGRIAEGIDRLLDLSEDDSDRLRRDVSAFVARGWTWDRTAQRLLDAAAHAPSGSAGATAPHGPG